MTEDCTRKSLIQQIWRGVDPFLSFPLGLYAPDMQGWNSVHPYLAGEIEAKRPSIIVEIGVWKGGSTITMAKKLKEMQLDAVVIAVDTWLGSWEHWLDPTCFDYLCIDRGRPQLYTKFVANIIAAGLQNYIVPLPLDSANAAAVLRKLNIRPDLIHIDGGHDYDTVSNDMKNWWSALADGGTFIGDDYYSDGRAWRDVKRAIDNFLSVNSHSNFASIEGKCRATKSAGCRSLDSSSGSGDGSD